MEYSNLAGKVVVITGSSSGLGRAIAASFAEEKAKVALLARRSGRLASAAEEMKQKGAEVLAIPTDVANNTEVERAAEKVMETWGSIDIWINNAMNSVFCFVWDIRAEEIKRVTEVTYLGQVYGTMAALKYMRPRNQGKIIFVGSALAYRGIPLQSAYCGAKHAIQGFFDSLRSELLHIKSGISISMVQLPAMNTPQFNWVKNCLPNRPKPIGKIYQPEVIARGVKYLAVHNRREMYIGFPTYKSIIGNKILPGYVDMHLAKTGVKGQQTEQVRDPDRQNNLWKPVEAEYGAHGDFDMQARNKSFTLTLAMHPNIVRASIAGLILVIILLIFI